MKNIWLKLEPDVLNSLTVKTWKCIEEPVWDRVDTSIRDPVVSNVWSDVAWVVKGETYEATKF